MGQVGHPEGAKKRMREPTASACVRTRIRISWPRAEGMVDLANRSEGSHSWDDGRLSVECHLSSGADIGAENREA